MSARKSFYGTITKRRKDLDTQIDPELPATNIIKKATVLFIFFLLFLSTFAPAQTTFIKIYYEKYPQTAWGVFQANDDGFIIVGIANVIDPDIYAYSLAMRVDRNGGVLWKRYLSDPMELNQSLCVVKAEGDYFVLSHGHHVRIHRLDDEGNVESHLVNVPGLFYSHSMALTLDGGLIIAGDSLQENGTLHDVLLVKTDLSGKVIWVKKYGDEDQWDNSVKVLQLNDGGFLVLAWKYKVINGTPFTDIWVFKTDAAGNFIWEKVIGGPEQNHPTDIIKTKDGAFLITSFNNAVPGFAAVTKIDENGNVLWDKPVNGAMYGTLRRVVETPEGNFIGIGERIILHIGSPDLPRSTLLWGLSADGDLLWQREYIIDPRYSSGYAITATHDGYYVGVGEVTNGNDTDVYLLKIDDQGCQINPPDLGEDSTTCLGPVKLDAGNDYKYFEWNTGDTLKTIDVDTTGEYVVKVGTYNYCYASDTVSVTIKDCVLFDHCKDVGYDKEEVEVPNVITANGDQWNEFFILPESLLGSQLTVYNRWGSQVYFSSEYKNNWNGSDLPGGIYFYTISNKCLSKSYKGMLSILK